MSSLRIWVLRVRGHLAFIPLALGMTTCCYANAASRPNFIFLIGEGQGWSTLSVPMDDRVPGSRSPVFHTPNLDRIAREGMRFANHYAPSPRCTASRAAFFTGKSPAQLHMTFVGEGRGDSGGGVGTLLIPARATSELPLAEITIAELLQEAGYRTAHFGKWHVGRTDPSRHGFDESTGPTSNGGPENSKNPNPKQAYASARLGIDFIARAVKSGKPFYLQIAQYAGRTALDADPDTLAAVRARVGSRDLVQLGAAAVAEDADLTYGLLFQKLESLGVLDNTYIFYTSDHGSPGRNTPLQGGKGMIWEGGLRVPLLVRGPGVAPGTIARQRTSGVDLFPTIAQLAGVSTTSVQGLEGGSLAPLFQSPASVEVKRPNEAFVVHFPHYDKDLIGPASAIYWRDLKLVHIYETGERRLYDLSKDMGERNDLAQLQLNQVTDLDQRLTDYLKSVNAQMPARNPNPDPDKSASSLPGERRRSPGGGKAAKRQSPTSPPQK